MTWADWYMVFVGALGVAFGAYGVRCAWRERADPEAWRRRRGGD
jgi:hypothetical protein